MLEVASRLDTFIENFEWKLYSHFMKFRYYQFWLEQPLLEIRTKC